MKKKLPLIMAIAAIVSLIGAVLILVLAVPRADATYKRVMEIIIACLMLLLSLLALTESARPRENSFSMEISSMQAVL